ncbi:FMN-dependent NADH-azoreductase [Paraburkholderia phenazinium]|uniref:FMN dependent NADH:quinone oxidoreductase n=1 Tax=Paraburkholderia phenazinium TaxID=60549 RepID=A0A1G8ASM3_9BURK|nr:NAD(P)H-dependent oxidoreductase [Paraburkholderia phenazinium]SDH24072.1 FMN-dependent NADH-azoreductase [Paraburkholderia phenazinium]
MSVLLHISASTRGDASHSRRIGRQLVDELQRRHGGPLRVIARDLAAQPPAYPDRSFVEAALMPQAQRGATQAEALALSEELIAELEGADALVIDTPMHNFTVPAVLKAWIDQVVRIGRTFVSSREGKEGLLQDRPVFLVVACGGAVPEPPTPSGQIDFLTPYLRYVLGTIGLRNVSALRLTSLARGAGEIAQADAHAAEWIAAAAAGWAGQDRHRKI